MLECLVVFFGRAAVFLGVFSFGGVLFQVVNQSFTGAQPRVVPNPSGHVACEAFSLAFGLSSTPAIALAFLLGFFTVPSCFLRLRPRLAVANHILSPTQVGGSPRFSHVPDHVIDRVADFRVVVQVSSPGRPVLERGFGDHNEPRCLAHFIFESLIGASQRSSFAVSGFLIMVSSDMESFVDLAWNHNANTPQALNSSVFNTALSLTPALPLHTLCRMRPSASDTSFRFQSKGFPCVTSYASTSLITIGWSRMAAGHSSRGLANKPGARTLGYVSTSPKNSAILSTRSAVYVSGQNFSPSRVLSLIFPLLGGLDHTDRCDCGAGLVLGVLRSLVSQVHQLIEASNCLLHFCSWGLPRELSGDPHEFSLHPASSNRKKTWVEKSLLRHHDKMVS